MLKNPMILKGYANTIYVLIFGVGLNMVMTCICAYVLSRKGPMLNRFFYASYYFYYVF